VTRPLVILVTGEPVAPARAARGSFFDMIRRAVGDAYAGGWRELDAKGDGPFPVSGELSGVIVTGSSASVTERAPWILRTEAWLAALVRDGTPVFGICFGHQLLGQALGGLVAQNPLGRQMGTLEAEITGEDPVLDPDARPFSVNTTHRDVVQRLPEGARVLGRTEKDPHAFVRFGPKVFGVQGHPEFDAVTMRAYVESRRAILEGEGFDVDAMLAGVHDALPGRSVLSRFVREHVRDA